MVNIWNRFCHWNALQS